MAKTHKIYYQGSPIGSIKSLSKTLDLTSSRLEEIAKNIPAHYTEFVKEVKSKQRNLAEPKRDLKLLQKRIISRIFTHLKFPHYLHGGIKAEPPCDFVTNAKAHSGAESAIALDIKNFFPSITSNQVETVFKILFKFPPPVARLLSSLTTLNGTLPQGSPTSSYIANLVISEQEYKLVSKFEGKGFTYTRLIDDITVSSKKALSDKDKNSIVKDIFAMVESYGFVIHPTKKYFYNRKNPEHLMQITGLWINRGAPRVSRVRRKEIETEVINLQKEALYGTGRFSPAYHDSHNSASGKVALLTRMKHNEAYRLRRILDSVMPIFDKAHEAKISGLVKAFHKKTQDQKKLGYLHRYYKLQHSISILKRTNIKLGKALQKQLIQKKPQITLREIYA